MLIENKFEIGDVVFALFEIHGISPNERKDVAEGRAVLLPMRVNYIHIDVCYGGTQVKYRCRDMRRQQNQIEEGTMFNEKELIFYKDAKAALAELDNPRSEP